MMSRFDPFQAGRRFAGSPPILSGPVGTELTQAIPFDAVALVLVMDTHFIGHHALVESIDSLRAAGKTVQVLEAGGGEPRLVDVPRLGAQVDGADAFIAVGGGSVIDMTKALALSLAAGGEVESFEGADKVSVEVPPIVAIPTTAGTGSEVTGSCVLTARDGRRKLSIRSSRLRPSGVVLDSRLLLGAPAGVVRAAGVDALGHAIESLTSTWATPATHSLSLSATQILTTSLPAFYADASDESAAAEIGWAACMAGLSFNSARVGLGHALASVIAPTAGLAHGTAVGLALPYHLRNVESLPDATWRSLAAALQGQADAADPQREALRRTKDLLAAVEAPTSLRDLGRAAHFEDEDARNVVHSGRLQSHPEVVSWQEVKTMLDDIATGA